MPRSRDTTADAVQLQLCWRMTSAQRTSIGNQMSIDARAIALAAIRARHPDYDCGELPNKLDPQPEEDE